jgi:membrane-bound serine protease (ClpP class)
MAVLGGRRTSAVLLLLAGIVLSALAGTARAQAPAEGSALVDVVEIDGVIDPAVARYLQDTIDRAAADGADLVAVQLNTPGGLRVDVEELVATITESEVPVLTFVGPASARASSVGTYLAYASHVLVMSPVTRMGAAGPADLGADAPDGRGREEAAELLVGLAELRGRSTEFAAAAVRSDQVLALLPRNASAEDIPADAITETDDVLPLSPDQAVDADYVDYVEPTLNAALERLSEGVEVTVQGPDGTPRTRLLQIDGASAQIRFNNLGLVRQVLHTVANPTIAYLLVMAGALAIAFEVFQPGFGVAGVSGLALLGLGLYGLAVLPVSWLAFGLVVLGLALLAVDLALAGLGALTAAGTVALGLGSFLLFRGPDVLRVSPWVLGMVVLFAVVFFVVIMTTVLRAQGNQAMAGAENLVGRTGVVRSMLNPEGHVFVQGALWRARAPESAGRVKTGTVVRVVGLNDALTLDVELVDSDDPAVTRPVG